MAKVPSRARGHAPQAGLEACRVIIWDEAVASISFLRSACDALIRHYRRWVEKQLRGYDAEVGDTVAVSSFPRNWPRPLAAVADVRSG